MFKSNSKTLSETWISFAIVNSKVFPHKIEFNSFNTPEGLVLFVLLPLQLLFVLIPRTAVGMVLATKMKKSRKNVLENFILHQINHPLYVKYKQKILQPGRTKYFRSLGESELRSRHAGLEFSAVGNSGYKVMKKNPIAEDVSK
ncbi:MAG: hypothetical protein IPH84_11240 [Bacteroidales bacterium]|nr:hypothetical protein [Bacteroidales bacterium]